MTRPFKFILARYALASEIEELASLSDAMQQ
jgi:hypothetical protein